MKPLARQAVPWLVPLSKYFHVDPKGISGTSTASAVVQLKKVDAMANKRVEERMVVESREITSRERGGQ